MMSEIDRSSGGGPFTVRRIGNVHLSRLRVVLWAFFAFCLIAPAVQFQIGTAKRDRQAATHPAAPHRPAGSQPQEQEPAPKDTKGAIGRWRAGIREFWQPNKNIYDKPHPYLPQRTWLHPNTPFTVILMTPLACLPVWAMVLSWNVLKVLSVVAAFFMTARLINHGRQRVPDWVVLLGFAWAAPMIAGDIQHGNTNCFVLAAVVLHLWLFRKGFDFLAGVPLALAICIKMTPALFILYWLYQRNGKLLAGVLVALILFIAVVPTAALGPERAFLLTYTWWGNLIKPGLIEGAAYPIHINQSIPGVFHRYLVGEPRPEGNIFWNPDDEPDYKRVTEFQWIAVADLPSATVRNIIRAAQAVIVLAGAWAIGWRRLPRRDGRRALHYGLVVLGMMLLNQRTWDHHATVLLVADAAVWYALVFGQAGRASRRWALGLMLVAGLSNLLIRGDLFKAVAVAFGRDRGAGEYWGNVYAAYGPVCLHFLLVFVAAVILAVSLRKREPPYGATEPA